MGGSRSVIKAGNRWEAVKNHINMGTVVNAQNLIEDAESGVFDPIVVATAPLSVTGNRRHQRNGISGQTVSTGIDVTLPVGVRTLLVDANADNRTVTLPGANNGREVYVAKRDASANKVVVKTPSGATLATLVSQNSAASFISDGTSWYVLWLAPNSSGM
jgi:hypothetical protein